MVSLQPLRSQHWNQQVKHTSVSTPRNSKTKIKEKHFELAGQHEHVCQTKKKISACQHSDQNSSPFTTLSRPRPPAAPATRPARRWQRRRRRSRSRSHLGGSLDAPRSIPGANSHPSSRTRESKRRAPNGTARARRNRARDESWRRLRVDAQMGK